MSSRSRVARWAAERAAFKLANRGDTHYAADKRLYKRQVSEMRREWLAEDLLARRAQYVASRHDTNRRAKSRERQQAAMERKRNSDEVLQSRAERAAAVALHQEREQKRIANERKVGEKALASRREAEDAFRRRWLNGVLQDYDVEGNTPNNAFSPDRKRAWLNPDNFDKRLPQLMIRAESPVDNWNSIARRLQHEEEREALNERLGGRLQLPPSDPGLAAIPSPQDRAGDKAPAAALAARTQAAGGGTSASSADSTVESGKGDDAGGGDAADKHAAFLSELKKTIANLDNKSDGQTPSAKTDTSTEAADDDPKPDKS